jgi:hypothetical protein
MMKENRERKKDESEKKERIKNLFTFEVIENRNSQTKTEQVII